MTTPVSASTARLADRLSLLQASGLRVPNASTGTSSVGARGSDSADLSDAGRRLGELQTALANLRQAFASARKDGIHAARSELDQTTAQLASLATRHDGFGVRNLSPHVSNASFSAYGLRPGEEVPIEVEVNQIAEPAEFFVQIPNSQVDLTSGSALTLQIVGNLGAHTFSFSSSQTLSQIVGAINHFSEETGVVAEPVPGVGSGFVLHSAEFGSGEYLSVRSVEGESNVQIGQVTDPLDPASAHVNPLHLYHFSIEDYGRDAEVTVNGHTVSPYNSYGNHVSFGYDDGPGRWVGGTFDLEPFYGQSFTAAVLRGTYTDAGGLVG